MTEKSYNIFDIIVNSTIPLPELAETQRGLPDLYFSLEPYNFSPPSNCDWFHHWYSCGNQIFSSCARTDEGYLMRFHNLSDFTISIEKKVVRACPVQGIPEDTVRHLLVDNVIPRLLGQQGRVVLHASAVTLENGTGIAFLGSSGWGKSTIVSSLVQHGARLLTDDCLLIDRKNSINLAIPNYSGIRLFSDSVDELFPDRLPFSTTAHYSEKKRLIMRYPKDLNVNVEIHALFLLGSPENNSISAGVEIEQLTGADSIIAIINKMFLLDVKDKDSVKTLFTNIGIITSNKLPIYSLNYPRKYSKLNDLRTAVLTAVQ